MQICAFCFLHKEWIVIFPGSAVLYKLMYVVGFALMMAYSVKYRERYLVDKVTAVVLTLCTYVFGVAGALAMGIDGAGDWELADP